METLKKEPDYFNESLDRLVATAKSLRPALDISSDKLRVLEKHLKDLKINFAVKFPITDINTTGDKFLSWELDTVSGSFRLMFTGNTLIKDSDGNEHEFYVRKPFIETKLTVRLTHARHVIPFMNYVNKKFKEFKEKSLV